VQSIGCTAPQNPAPRSRLAPFSASPAPLSVLSHVSSSPHLPSLHVNLYPSFRLRRRGAARCAPSRLDFPATHSPVPSSRNARVLMPAAPSFAPFAKGGSWVLFSAFFLCELCVLCVLCVKAFLFAFTFNF